VLIVGMDLMSRTVDPADKKTYPLFGDGGGAILLGPGEEDQGLISYTLGSEGDLDGWLHQRAGGTREPITAEALEAGRQFIHMEGRAVFKWAVRVLEDSTKDVLSYGNLTADDIDVFIYHQANVRIIKAALNVLNIDRDRVVINVDRYGNTSAGSMPLALHEAIQDGRVGRGGKVLLSGFGGGLAWGTAVMQW
jgi:3-oxoacyl-[acyl-carrier-protein] synthase-3